MSADTGERREMAHYVSEAPFDPHSIEALSPEQERYYMASQWQLMWWKFIRHRLALISGGFLLLMYGSILISEFLAPYNLHTRNINAIYAPPQSVHLFHEGEFIGPFVYGTHYRLNLTNLRREYTEDTSKIYRINFFCSGDEYSFWGVAKGTAHLFCVEEGGTIFLLGTDRLGRDIMSRIMYGARISLTRRSSRSRRKVSRSGAWSPASAQAANASAVGAARPARLSTRRISASASNRTSESSPRSMRSGTRNRPPGNSTA